MKKIESLHDAFVLKLQALYDVEKQIVEVLPKVANAVTNEELKKALQNHVIQTENQIERLENIFDMLSLKPSILKGEAIRGLIADTEWIMEQNANPEVLDVMIIASVLYVEQYESAGYTSASNWANDLEYQEIEGWLTETLDEEEKSTEILLDISDEISEV